MKINFKPAVEFDSKYGTSVSHEWDFDKFGKGMTSDKI